MEIMQGTQCTISPTQPADQYYKLPNCDRLLPLCPYQARRHNAVSETQFIQRIAVRNLNRKAKEDEEILELIAKFESTENKED